MIGVIRTGVVVCVFCMTQAAFACGNVVDLEACIGEYHKKSDIALNSQYRLSMNSLPLEYRDRLKAVEFLWLDYRQDVCGGLNALDRPGCESALMNQRTQELYFIEKKVFARDWPRGL